MAQNERWACASSRGERADLATRGYVSYASPDRRIARELVDKLEDAGHAVRFIDRETTAGANWRDKVERALNASSAMIVLISPASMSSKQVHSEIEHAFFSKYFAHRVLPVNLRASDDVPWFLRKQKRVTMGTDHKKTIQKIKSVFAKFDEQLSTSVEDNT
jgi:TIR domain